MALVVDVHGMARSLAAVVKGYSDFEPDLRVAGVIVNRCGSERHASWLASVLDAASLPPLLGGVMNDQLPPLSSRHLGLVTAGTGNLSPSILDRFADAFDRHFFLDKLLEVARNAPVLDVPRPETLREYKPSSLGVARDEAFHFYYQDLFDELALRGCTVKLFSPLADQDLPPNLDALYFGGGYPELHADALSAHQRMRTAVRGFASSGRPVYAECGGLMYLCRVLETTKGAVRSMVGLLPGAVRMLDHLKTLGYVEVALQADSLWGTQGSAFRGHEFHYSELIHDPEDREGWQSAYTLKHYRSETAEMEGFQRGRLLASYVHLHLASRPAALDYFLKHVVTGRTVQEGGHR